MISALGLFIKSYLHKKVFNLNLTPVFSHFTLTEFIFKILGTHSERLVFIVILKRECVYFVSDDKFHRRKVLHPMRDLHLRTMLWGIQTLA
jgi:hypothetical protein